MSDNCQMVVFSNKAYNAIIRESFAKDPVETGGILLGHILDNGIWIVMEVLPPGIRCIFERAYFEYDDAFVNYLAQSVANQYKLPLDLLGLWHRHPGSMDYFSSTDDGTNATFASQNPKGVISGLVNIDPKFRLTMYHMPRMSASAHFNRPPYENISIEVGDDIIPAEYFELKYYDGESSNLHPTLSRQNINMHRQVNSATTRNDLNQHESSEEMPLDIKGIVRDNSEGGNDNNDDRDGLYSRSSNHGFIDDMITVLNVLKKKWKATLLIVLVLIAFGCTIKSIYTTIEQSVEWGGDLFGKGNVKYLKISLNPKESKRLEDFEISKEVIKKYEWTNSNKSVVSFKNGVIEALKKGTASIIAKSKDKIMYSIEISVKNNSEQSIDGNGVMSLKVQTNPITVILGDNSQKITTSPENNDVEWISKNQDLFIVESKNQIKPIKIGKGKAIATFNGEDLECTIVIENSESAVETVALLGEKKQGQLSITKNPNTNMKFILKDKKMPNINWTVNDNNIATIDKNGTITLKKKGIVVISVSYGNNSEDFTLTIKD